MELAVLSAPDAIEMAAGTGRFAPYGRLALTRVLELGDHLLVAEAGFPVRHGWMVTSALHDSGLVTSLDLVELNPFLDERGRTATLMTDLAASLLGRRVFDRSTKAF